MNTSDWLQWVAAVGGVAATVVGLVPLWVAHQGRREALRERLKVGVRRLNESDLILSVAFDPLGRHDALKLEVASLSPGVRLMTSSRNLWKDGQETTTPDPSRFATAERSLSVRMHTSASDGGISGLVYRDGGFRVQERPPGPRLPRVSLVLTSAPSRLEAARVQLAVRSTATGRRQIAKKIAVSAEA